MLIDETKLQRDLQDRFPFLADHVRVARERRVFAETPYEHFAAVFEGVVKDLDFPILCMITGLDLGERLGLIYHLARNNGLLLSLQTSVPKASPVVQTVTARFPAADCYERELADLLGFEVQGLPPGSRYPLPDGWPAGQFPLRKDWHEEPAEGLGGGACQTK
jgi:membrane-bound hydrogenase subunit beta